MQVYRGMDVGTAKPTFFERQRVAHHMIDLVDPEFEYSVADFRREGRELLKTLEGPVIVAGGSGLHFRSLVDPMTFAPTDPQERSSIEAMATEQVVEELLEADPESGNVVDLANARRVTRALEILRLGGGTPSERAASEEAGKLRRYESELAFQAFGVDPGEELRSRIDERLSKMISGGLVEEVRSLEGRFGRTAGSAVGYRELLLSEAGEISQESAFDLIRRNTWKLARRQRTWFQRDPRIRWLPWDSDPMSAVRRVEEALL